MSRKSAAAPKQDLCYDMTMKAVSTPDVAKKVVRHRKPLINKKYIVTPATAEEISRGVGVTKKDAAVVDKILRRLGYLPEEEPARKKPRSSGKEKTTTRQS